MEQLQQFCFRPWEQTQWRLAGWIGFYISSCLFPINLPCFHISGLVCWCVAMDTTLEGRMVWKKKQPKKKTPQKNPTYSMCAHLCEYIQEFVHTWDYYIWQKLLIYHVQRCCVENWPGVEARITSRVREVENRKWIKKKKDLMCHIAVQENRFCNKLFYAWAKV